MYIDLIWQEVSKCSPIIYLCMNSSSHFYYHLQKCFEMIELDKIEQNNFTSIVPNEISIIFVTS